MGESSSPGPARARRDALSVLGMVAVAGAAAFTSYSGLDGLAQLAGWPRQLAMLLPVTIDAYAMTATRVWLSPARLTRKARGWARGNAIGAIATSVLGNTVFHAAAAHVLSVTWPVVVGISAIPSVVLGLTVHLWHVADDLEPESKPGPTPPSGEPETVRAAYPVLGEASAPKRPQAPDAKRTSNASQSGSGSALRGAPHAVSGAAAVSRPSAPGRLPSASASGAPGRAADGASPPRSADREERVRGLLRDARRLNTESVERGDGPISARRLARELHISQDTARQIIKELPERKPPAHTGAPPATDAAPHSGSALHARDQVHQQATAPTSPGAPSLATTSAPAPAPSAPGHFAKSMPDRDRDALADTNPGAPGQGEPSTAQGALAGQRPEPVEHANGSSVEQS